MITSKDYIKNTNLQRDLLAAFSATDHSISTQMNDEQIQAKVNRLLLRLSALCGLHGGDSSRKFINTLQASDSSTLFEVITSFIEIGKLPSTDAEKETVRRRELQQEVLHFSRIVDVQDEEMEFQNKRLRNSKNISESLKVLCEFITVARGRLVQYGKSIQVPIARPAKQLKQELSENLSLVCGQEPTDYLLFIKASKAKFRKDLSFLYEMLLTYLTPSEGLSVLSTHLIEEELIDEDVSFALVVPVAGEILQVIQWHSSPKKIKSCSNEFELCLAHIPDSLEFEIKDTSSMTLWSDAVLKIGMEASGLLDSFFLNLDLDGLEYKWRLSFADSNFPLQNQEKIISNSLSLFNYRNTATIVSIESGHIHLDRQIDADQLLGVKIGYELWKVLAETQASAPLLTPMIDDDHVLVQLAARDYEKFFRAENPKVEFELIPESSPIIRAIACAIFNRLMATNHKKKYLSMQGNNLLLKVPDENIICEIFEDFNGRCDTGCVFFEPALLVYRSSPALFSQAFHQHFKLEFDVHKAILARLDPSKPHDLIYSELEDFNRQFREVTDPHHPSTFFCDLVDGFLSKEDKLFIHLNVLEDYYEAQQFKVRKLLRFLELPVLLWSFHFNRMTGRIHFEKRTSVRQE